MSRAASCAVAVGSQVSGSRWTNSPSRVPKSNRALEASFLLGIMWNRTSAAAAFTTLSTMIPFGVVGFIFTQIPSLQVFEIQFLYAAGISFALSIVLLVAVSLVTTPPSREVVENLTWRPELYRIETEELRGTPWYLNYRYMSIALLVVTGAVVIWWA